MSPTMEKHFTDSILPLVLRNAMSYASIGNYSLEYRNEFLAEIAAIAWECYRQAIINGRQELHAGNFWWVAKRRWSSGRRFKGRSHPRDVLEPVAHKDKGTEVVPLSDLAESMMPARWCRSPDPGELVAFTIDLNAFRHRLDDLDRSVLDFRLLGYRVSDIARLLKRSYTAINSALRRLQKSANEFYFQSA